MTADIPSLGITAELRAALQTLARTPELLLALDFDGTMSPLVDRAQDARPLPRSAAALAAFAALPRTTTALVSGRALASLRLVATPPQRTLLVGSHGAETWLGPDSPAVSLTAEQESALETARAAVAREISRIPGTLAENKPAGVVLHYRLAEEAAARAGVERLMAELAHTPSLHLSHGKMVLEISVINANKGQSLALLRQETGATAIFFAGDDVTDEHAFAALRPGDLGIKVGPGNTQAQFRIATPASLPDVLELLLAERTAYLSP
ncbi:trehalose 6-phosphate phosphatase [Arthrobacter sp. UYCu511]|uniref:trehalose-phosphatase n=1 Tax=Arthrobacter sp. UYCu511 TaxID=3156337 RepID=UPI003396775E